MGETISLSEEVSAGLPVSAGTIAILGREAVSVEVDVVVSSGLPLCSFRRRPSFSISKTERSFFFIKSMIALISLMSLGSTTCSCQKLKRLGKAVLGMRSRQSWLLLAWND